MDNNPFFMKLKHTKMASLVAALITFGSLAGGANGALVFTVVNFTEDNLTITMPVGSDTLDGSGGARDLFLIASVPAQASSWVVNTSFTASGSGSIGIRNLDLEAFTIYNNLMVGGRQIDIVRLSVSDVLATGDTVTSAVTASWSGDNIFNPSAVDSFTLVWDTTNINSSYPFGFVQSSAPAAPAVPEPSLTILSALGALGLAARRKRNA